MKSLVHSLLLVSDKDRSVVNLNVIINIHRFSSKRKLQRVTARVLKFVRLLRKEGQEMTREIEASDIKEADRKWIRSTQEQLFPEEVKSLRARKTVVYSNQFILFLQDDIIRCRGRINEASLPCHAKNPILLPEKHYFSELVIKEKHIQVHHNGVRDTLTATREDYWILKARKLVKRIIRHCVLCRRYEGKPYETPLIPDRPVERVSEDPPFNNTGVDFAGPIYVKDGHGSTTTCKVYICLFTCASTRALHLEIVRDMSTGTFLQAFRRFCGRRGILCLIMRKHFKPATRNYKRWYNLSQFNNTL